MVKHTPAPWFVTETDDNKVVICDNTYLNRHLAYLTTGTPSKECEANAKIIAAAPELLEALKEVERALDVGVYDIDDFMAWLKDYGLSMIQRVISKAEGGTTDD